MSLTASSKIIIPTECSYLAMVGLKQIYNTIQSIHKHSNKDLCVLGILLIKYNGRANINIAISNALEKLSVQMNTKIFACKIRETIKVKEAQSQQEPIIDWDPSCTAVQDYLDFVKELTSNLA